MENETFKQQDKVNTDSIDDLIEKGVVENVYR